MMRFSGAQKSFIAGGFPHAEANERLDHLTTFTDLCRLLDSGARERQTLA
jgi:hypothetical protein